MHAKRTFRTKPTGRPRTPVMDRIWAKIVVHPLGCWEYQGHLIKGGYGMISLGGRPGRRALVHRIMYRDWFGSIPGDLTLDHLCFNTRCCNPNHLEPVTRSENTKRQWRAGRADAGKTQLLRTHCKRGHPFDEQNTRHYDNKRVCRACARHNYAKRKGTQ